MNEKKVVTVIVEGPSDENAIGGILKEFFSWEEVQFAVVHGDITSNYSTTKENVLPQVIRASKWSTQKSITEIGYKRVAENNLYEIFDKLMFATDGDISSTFGKIRNKLDATQKKWISQGEKDNLEEISKAMSVQKQREFVPYA